MRLLPIAMLSAALTQGACSETLDVSARDASAGHDAAVSPDTSASAEAAAAPDVGVAADAAAAPDAALIPDAARTPDASSAFDAGAARDGSNAADVGASDDTRPAPGVDAAAEAGHQDAGQVAAPSIRFAWRLRHIGGDELSCADAGTPFVEITASDQSSGIVRRERFDCGAGVAATASWPQGTYVVTITLLDATPQVVAALPSLTIDVQPGRVAQLADREFAIQSFVTVWGVMRAGVAITCQSARADKVHLDATEEGRPPLRFVWPCAEGMGLTTAVPLGSYQLQMRLVDNLGTTLSQTQRNSWTVTADARAVLPSVVFEVL